VRLFIDQRFARVTVERFAEIYLSEAFNEAVAPVSGLKSRRLVEEKRAPDGSRERRVRMQPAVTLPGPIQKLADGIAGRSGAGITYDEVSTFDPEKNEVRFRIDSRANDRVRFEGTIRFVADGDGVRRTIDGIIEVKAPLGLGGLIERFIEAETKKGYEKIALFLQRWVDEHPPG
jgi:hypothetical protein